MAPSHNLPRSNVLLFGSNSIQSLLPATLTSQIESMLENHRVSDAVGLADQQRKRLQGQRRVEQSERDEIAYVYQRIGFVQLEETSFEEAGRNLFIGELDPRILISYYPELRGGLFREDTAVDTFAGIADCMPQHASVDEIIAANLVLNYSPYLESGEEKAAAASELRQLLRQSAEQAIEIFLRMSRFKQRTSGKDARYSSDVAAAVDTVLVNIYAKAQNSKELHTLLKEPNDVIESEVESTLIACGQYTALCKLYELKGRDDKLLDAWSKIADGEWVESDKSIPKMDPISNIEALLATKRDRGLIAHWAVWLMKKDPDRGLRLVLSRDGGKRNAKAQEEEDVKLLEEIQQASPTAANHFLEHLILQKRTLNLALHNQFAHLCVDRLLSCLEDESVHKLWRAKTASFVSGPPPTSFLSYFADTTPDSDAKRIRLKAVLYLQGSAFYDQSAMLDKLTNTGRNELLHLETAIVQGKLARHKDALATLVHKIHDAVSAEVYCSLGGVVVPSKVAHSLAEAHELSSWSAVLFPVPRGLMPGMLSRQPSRNDDLRKSLVKTLLEVYMDGGPSNAGRTARLLDSQAMNVDVLEVISLIPDDWSVTSMSPFLTRSFRRALHTKHEGQIVKNIAMAENMKVKEESWLEIRERGADVEEELEESDQEEGVTEKAEFVEKVSGSLESNKTVELFNEKRD